MIVKNKYSVTRTLLGAGSFSKVYLGKNTETDENVAVKVIDWDILNSTHNFD